jgi:Zn-dependent protease
MIFMSMRQQLGQGFRIFANPAFLLVYACYTILISFISEYYVPVQIFTLIFIEPLLFSYVASRYFIDAVDPARLAEHRRLRFRFYIPFVKIFGSMLLSVLIFGIIIFGSRHQDISTSLPILALYTFISVTLAFWMAGTIFSRCGFWKGLRQAVVLVRKNLLLYLLFFVIYFIFGIFHELYGFGYLKGGAVMPFVILHLVIAFFDLYTSRVAIAMAAGSQDINLSKAVLNDYINPAQAQIGRGSQTQQIKKANKCLLLGVLSIIPGVHFFALVLGWKRFKYQEFGRFRSMVGLILGAFFTMLYCLALMGNLLSHQRINVWLEHRASLDIYLRDSAVSPALKQVLQQLKDGKTIDYSPAVLQLESMKEDQSLARYFALGIANEYENNSKAALDAFKKCLTLPGYSPEVYFHIGRINLFDTHDYFEARNSLVKFLTYSPDDKTASRYISLIDNRVEWDKNWIISILSVIALLIAMTSHEFGHSYTAYKCGDMTSKDAGRMSLNPLVHLDLLGSVILPAFLILSRSSIILGWAKSVPVNPGNFKNPQRDSTLVSLMGCFTNFSIALAATLVFALVSVVIAIAAPDFVSLHWFFPGGVISVAGLPFAKFWIYCSIFLSLMIAINIAIGIFNLIPIPPLDGSWLVERRLAPLLKDKYAAYQQFSFLLILILLFTGIIDLIIGSVLNAYFICVQLIIIPALKLT